MAQVLLGYQDNNGQIKNVYNKLVWTYIYEMRQVDDPEETDIYNDKLKKTVEIYQKAKDVVIITGEFNNSQRGLQQKKENRRKYDLTPLIREDTIYMMYVL